MTDVFVSYARADERQAERITHALRENGHKVWRDDDLPAHRPYTDVIEERLRSAKAVVVLWSADASKSQWVRSEANLARSAGTLVQAVIDASMPPLPFDQIQCANLDGWTGDVNSPAWRKLVASVAELTGVVNIEPLPPRERSGAPAVCVLPFQNMSGDPEQEYFSDGISEDITTDLSKISALEVIARNSAFQYKGQSIDVVELARKLGVTHVVEGSVRKAGGRVRITAQLIDGKTGAHVWAERFDRDLTDIFLIQDEISNAIVAALKLRLLPEEKKAIEQRGTNSVEAYNLYLMAKGYWVTGNWGDVRQAELVARVCQRAIDIDENYAKAWGLLAIVECILHFVHQRQGADGLAAAERALSLDSRLAEAWVVKARHLHELGRFEEANELLEQAVKLGPESWEVHHEAGTILYFERRYKEAARHFEAAVTLAETDFHSWGMLSSIYEELGDQDGVRRAAQMAISHAERVVAKDPTNGAALAMGATGLAILGERQRFQEWSDRAQLVDPDNMIMQYNLACAMARRFEDCDGALDLLERRLNNVPPTLFRAILNDPDLERLRDLRRFKAMIEKAKLRLGVTENGTRY
ncbi:MAG TPA: TIR domain-containing protein [Bradyrhizobium sp.]|uniref:TIR domain-containing protein n=1 Tax=Bradyrhizobium sp. TaxID=376 RepID=UPI002B49D158|nr:TIR domain-containing protein [Bradyrhizobium sp.]HKO69966.1 TIR domain-containing protein [Bradyrhizobium sp.]